MPYYQINFSKHIANDENGKEQVYTAPARFFSPKPLDHLNHPGAPKFTRLTPEDPWVQQQEINRQKGQQKDATATTTQTAAEIESTPEDDSAEQLNPQNLTGDGLDTLSLKELKEFAKGEELAVDFACKNRVDLLGQIRSALQQVGR